MIADIVILFINLLITLVVGIINFITSILPESPFVTVNLSIPSHLVGMVNYIIPLNLIIPVFTAWAGAVVAYKFVKWIMHVLKVE